MVSSADRNKSHFANSPKSPILLFGFALWFCILILLMNCDLDDRKVTTQDVFSGCFCWCVIEIVSSVIQQQLFALEKACV